MSAGEQATGTWAAGFDACWLEKGWPALCRPLGDTDFECAPAAKKAA